MLQNIINTFLRQPQLVKDKAWEKGIILACVLFLSHFRPELLQEEAARCERIFGLFYGVVLCGKALFCTAQGSGLLQKV